MPLVLTLVLGLLRLVSGQWEVIGPDKPIQASAGEDVIFTCFLTPETSAAAMEVRFFRNHFSAVVHFYSNGKELEHMQMPAFRGRTEFLKDSIVNGRVSLRLKKITPLDAGLYGCSFSFQTYYQEAVWELQVSALGSTPLVSIMGYAYGEIQLCCQSSGWFPQPMVKWKRPQGHDLPSDSKVNVDKQGLFDVETYLTIQENSGSISCSIQIVEQSQSVESRVWIGETFFQPSPWRMASILLGFFFFGLCVCIIGQFIFLFKCQRKLQEELNWRRKQEQTEWRDAQKHKVELTLDPDSAHPQLCISNLREVTYVDVPQEVPDSEKRFIRMCVVASQGFSAGKHYWEVYVGKKEGWCLGVCLDEVDRKMQFVTLSPNNGYWILGHSAQDQYFSYNPHGFYLSPRTPPTQVGIFLDYEGGTISFFNINDQSLIYTLTHPFKGLLRPYIQYWPCSRENLGKIVICPMSLGSRLKPPPEVSPHSQALTIKSPSVE
ncbi:butyrophilin-like protein 3 [Dasypus novemcinctus]|uniref:butyrophilin-like protein 3 n=1 Tax=Dasypus novemcinctus TaxID=9361 RepID=UPI00265DE1F3|nr:butyrophilin-like protein 3 [Dasypus novemcinctus]